MDNLFKICLLTWVLINPLLHSVLLLVNPLAVALEVYLGGRSGLAVQVHRLVLDYIGLLWFHQKHRQRLRGIWREGFRQITKTDEVIVNCEERDGNKTGGGRERGRKRWKERWREAEVENGGRKPKIDKERERKDGLGEKGNQTRDRGTVYYNHSLCMGLSIRAAHSEIPIIWYFGMFTQVYFRAQEILGFLSGNKAAWIYRNRALLGLTTTSYCWETIERLSQ